MKTGVPFRNRAASIRNRLIATAAGIAGGAYAVLNTITNQVYCDAGFLTNKEVTVDPDVDPVTAMSKLLTIVAGIFIAVGLFQLVGGIFSYLEAKGEDNAMAESKAVKKMAIGVAFLAAPFLITFIFT